MSKRGQHRADGRGGGYILLPHVVSDALLPVASPRAIAILIAILRGFNGFNNGSIAISMRDMGKAIGSPENSANAAAVQWLEDRGFIRVRRFPKGQRKASEYELTFITTGRNGDVAASNDYLARLETKKSAVGNFQPRTAPPDASFHTRRKQRVGNFHTGATENSAFGGGAPVPDFPTHILSHVSARSVGAQIPSQLGSNSSAAPSSVMDLADLRSVTLDYLSGSPAGTQSRIAHQLEIPAGTLSKFLNGRSLPPAYRMPLQLEIGRRRPWARGTGSSAEKAPLGVPPAPCEHCRGPVELIRAPRPGVPQKRFCSEACRKKAETARAKKRRRAREKEAASTDPDLSLGEMAL